MFNLLNLGVGGQAQVQQPILAAQGLLSQRLGGLRSSTSTRTTSGGGGNPFLSAALGAAGTAFGGPIGGAIGSQAAGLFG